MLLITKLFQLDEGAIKSILSNGEGSHFQIAPGSHIGNSNTWIKTFMKDFMPFNLLGSSFPKPWGVDEDKWQLPLKVYQKRKGVGSKAQTLIWHSLNDNGLGWNLI